MNVERLLLFVGLPLALPIMLLGMRLHANGVISNKADRRMTFVAWGVFLVVATTLTLLKVWA